MSEKDNQMSNLNSLPNQDSVSEDNIQLNELDTKPGKQDILSPHSQGSDKGIEDNEKTIKDGIEIEGKETDSIEEDKSAVYYKNEKVLCYHGPLLYEAKILKSQYWDQERIDKAKASIKKTQSKLMVEPDSQGPGFRYFVHYKGWKNRWDEWVIPGRMLKWNDENLAKQKELIESVKGAPKKAHTPKSPTKPKPETPASLKHSPSVSLASSPLEPNSKAKKRNLEAVETKSKRLQAARQLTEEVLSPSTLLKPILEPIAHTNLTQLLEKEAGQEENIGDGPSTRIRNSQVVTARNRANSTSSNKPSAIKLKNKEDVNGEETEFVKEVEAPLQPAVELSIPDSLKLHLVDQWDHITRGQRLVPLPRAPSARQILERYREHALAQAKRNPSCNKSRSSSRDVDDQANSKVAIVSTAHTADPIVVSLEENSHVPINQEVLNHANSENKNGINGDISRSEVDIINEVVDGLGLYFAKTIGSFLLYRFERAQYSEILSHYPKANECQDSSYHPIHPSAPANMDLLDVYGAEHLVRLFVHLPFLLAHAELEVAGLELIQAQLNDFLAYLDIFKGELFTGSYETAPPSYSHQIRSE